MLVKYLICKAVKGKTLYANLMTEATTVWVEDWRDATQLGKESTAHELAATMHGSPSIIPMDVSSGEGVVR